MQIRFGTRYTFNTSSKTPTDLNKQADELKKDDIPFLAETAGNTPVIFTDEGLPHLTVYRGLIASVPSVTDKLRVLNLLCEAPDDVLDALTHEAARHIPKPEAPESELPGYASPPGNRYVEGIKDMWWDLIDELFPPR